MKRRVDVRLPRRGEARSSGPPLLALVLHIVVVVLVVRAVSMPVLDFLSRTGARPVVEQITYVEAEPEPEPERPLAAVPPSTRGPQGAVPPAAAALPVMPTLPGVADTGRGTPAGPPIEAGAGRQIFGSGVSGLSTGPVDPRLIAPPGIPDGPVRARARDPNALVNSWVGTYWDSVAKVEAERRQRRAPGDWTVGEEGRKYGADQQFIYFGKYKLPTVLLALLPINAQANPGMVERNRALQSMRWEIDFHAQRAQNEAEFRKAVDELRLRRERDRRAQEAQTLPPARPGVRVPPELP